VLLPHHRQCLLRLRLLVHLGDPGLQAALQGVCPVPAIRRRVGNEPLGRVGPHLRQGRADASQLATQLRHQAACLPLGLAADVTVDPEAVAASSDDLERRLVLLVRDESGGVDEQPILLEPEGVHGAQVGRVHVCTREAQVLLYLVGQDRIGFGMASAQALSDVASSLGLFLASGARNHADGLRGLAGEIAPELVHQHVAHRLRSRLAHAGALRQLQT
jgi:hypothetical protein